MDQFYEGLARFVGIEPDVEEKPKRSPTLLFLKDDIKTDAMFAQLKAQLEKNDVTAKSAMVVLDQCTRAFASPELMSEDLKLKWLSILMPTCEKALCFDEFGKGTTMVSNLPVVPPGMPNAPLDVEAFRATQNIIMVALQEKSKDILCLACSSISDLCELNPPLISLVGRRLLPSLTQNALSKYWEVRFKCMKAAFDMADSQCDAVFQDFDRFVPRLITDRNPDVAVQTVRFLLANLETKARNGMSAFGQYAKSSPRESHFRAILLLLKCIYLAADTHPKNCGMGEIYNPEWVSEIETEAGKVAYHGLVRLAKFLIFTDDYLSDDSKKAEKAKAWGMKTKYLKIRPAAVMQARKGESTEHPSLKHRYLVRCMLERDEIEMINRKCESDSCTDTMKFVRSKKAINYALPVVPEIKQMLDGEEACYRASLLFIGIYPFIPKVLYSISLALLSSSFTPIEESVGFLRFMNGFSFPILFQVLISLDNSVCNSAREDTTMLTVANTSSKDGLLQMYIFNLTSNNDLILEFLEQDVCSMLRLEQFKSMMGYLNKYVCENLDQFSAEDEERYSHLVISILKKFIPASMIGGSVLTKEPTTLKSYSPKLSLPKLPGMQPPPTKKANAPLKQESSLFQFNDALDLGRCRHLVSEWLLLLKRRTDLIDNDVTRKVIKLLG